MIEPSIVLRAGIPLTRTVQRPGEFIINFPGAYHSGFNNGYNCAESCNFATEYWIPFGVQVGSLSIFIGGILLCFNSIFESFLPSPGKAVRVLHETEFSKN